MGIKDYLKYIQLETPESKCRIYNYFYVDCNYLLHYLIYKCKSDLNLYNKLYNYIDYLLDTITIINEIYLVFDGNHDTELVNPKLNTLILRNKYKKISDDYDKQPIYPNSKIINTFKQFLEDIINKFKKILKKTFLIKFIDSSINGEADFKILKSIYESNFNNICILSKDSDMILISYSLIINKNIKIDILSNLRPIMFIDVNQIVNNFNNSYDYILIILFLGNDYLPKISNINYDIIITNYKKYINHENESIIVDKKINYYNLQFFITYLITNNTKKLKFNINNINIKNFNIYYNNLCYCLKEYKILDNNLKYLNYNFDKNGKNSYIVNIFNFINFSL